MQEVYGNPFASSIRYHLEPIGELLDDPSVSEVMINGPETIYFEKSGLLRPYRGQGFYSEEALRAACVNIAQYSQQRLDDTHLTCDARLPDGSRVHIVMPPLCEEISIAIRKFQKSTLSIQDLIRSKTLTPEVASFLEVAINIQKNMVVSGGTSSGKTTLLNLLSSYIPEQARLVVIEDSRELQLQHKHQVCLECKNFDKVRYTLRDLLRSALRLRPDRIVVGEVRGAEALDLLNALNSGHSGTMTTLHASTATQALSKLETLVLSAGEDLPLRAIRSQIASSIDIILQAARLRDGQRRVVQIAEVLSQLDEHGSYRVRYLYRYRTHGISPEGQIQGRLEPTGLLPSFFEEAKDQGLDISPRDFGLEEESNEFNELFPDIQQGGQSWAETDLDEPTA